MIRQITGIAVAVFPAYTVIDVNGVGYSIFTTTHAGCVVGEKLTLFTYLAVRENALDLYGFTTHNELSFFELLLTLPKIGPKSALQILSQADLTTLHTAIASQDHEYLSKVSGIGKKTAEKVVTGLKDAFENYAFAQEQTASEDVAPSFSSDAIDALVTLGYPQADARKAIQKLLAQKPEITNTNDAIREALKVLG